MDAYLINNGQGFSILYNKSKALEEKLKEPYAELQEGRLARHMPLRNLFRLMAKHAEQANLKQHARHLPLYNLAMYVSKWSERITYSSNGRALIAGAGAGSFMLHYADTRSEDEARAAFGEIVKQEIKRCYAVTAAHAILIPAGYLPPLTFVPTTVPFLLAMRRSLKARKSIKKSAEKARFMPNSVISMLESRILEGNRSTEDWFSECDFT